MIDTISIPKQVPLDLEQGNVDLQPAGTEENSKKNLNSNEPTANPQSTRDEVIRTASPVVDCREMLIASSLASSNSVTAENGNEIEKNQNYEVHFDTNLVKESLDDRFVLSEMEKLKKFEIENLVEVGEELEEEEQTKENNEQNCELEMEYENKEKIFAFSEKKMPRSQCEQCEKYYINLEQHIRYTHNKTLFTCPECSFKTKHKSSLTTHIKSIHRGIRILCNQCENTFATPGQLKLHDNSKHKNIRYHCIKCPKTTSDQCKLKQHLLNNHGIT